MESQEYLSQQVLTYLGNKRKLLTEIEKNVKEIIEKEGGRKMVICDIFSGSGVVARMLKQYSGKIIANDLEEYSKVINECYLANKSEFDEQTFNDLKKKIDENETVSGVITENYAPKDDTDIKEGERAFYTHENALIIDTYRNGIEKYVPKKYESFFMAPLLYEASVHVNTSGVFKGFYKSKEKNVGKFGGDGENALDRILGKIDPKKPVFSNFECEYEVYSKDANVLAQELDGIDITYMDPPYNQHPYGSNYFMLNTILKNEVGEDISKVSGIPKDWNKSSYNKKKEALLALDDLIKNIDSKYVIISYNNEGFISYGDMIDMLRKYGRVSSRGIDYVAFRGSRNLKDRNTHTMEFLFTLEKDEQWLRSKSN